MYTILLCLHGDPREGCAYRGTSLTSNCPYLGPYSRPMPRAQRCSQGAGAVSYERGTPADGALDVLDKSSLRPLLVQEYPAYKTQPSP